jgi:hypothetical protein
MAINGPKNATPTLRGWVSPKGELLKSQRITQAQIDEWHGMAMAPAKPAKPVKPTVQADPLEAKSKVELEAMAREHGVELDRRKSKKKLAESLRNILSK